jgi:hypothetical protein
MEGILIRVVIEMVKGVRKNTFVTEKGLLK